jgi:thioesterase domain-containing protein
LATFAYKAHATVAEGKIDFDLEPTLALIDDVESPPSDTAASSPVTLVQDKSEVRQTIARLWAEMAPFASHMDESIAWRETGADSLLTLQFLVRLERVLEYPLSFDMFTLDMTVGEVIEAIEKSQQPGGGRHASADKVTIFLVPGILGDEPKLAEFRRSLIDKIHFETLRVLDIDQPGRILSRMSAVAADLVRKINDIQPEGPLYLAGYSMGGMLAFEAASALVASGRDVRLVGILDAMYGRPLQPTKKINGQNEAIHAIQPRPSRLIKREKETLALYLDRLIYKGLVTLRLYELARRWAVAFAGQNNMVTNENRRQFLLPIFRGRSIFSWRPKPCPAPALLFVSDEFERKTSTETWAQLCPNLTIQRVPGEHGKIYEPEGLAKINPALLAALDRVRP